MDKIKVAVVAGARPNFMKVAPLLRELAARNIQTALVHTGQHYDAAMSDVFFEQLEIPKPDVHLNVGSSSHGRQTAAVMAAYEEWCEEARPTWTLVVGDVNSTLACALVSAKMGIKVCHVEAGLRSNDWTMPEEVNRVLTDRLSDLLLTHSPEAEANLSLEGIDLSRVHCVGNVMIDTLFHLLPKAKGMHVAQQLGFGEAPFAFCTLHRPSNVDEEYALKNIVEILVEASSRLPVVFPVHPRTRTRLEMFGLLPVLENQAVRVIEPVGYLECVSLSSDATVVLTDSGGLQEETTALGVPCLTLRNNTERPITVLEGTNQVVGTERATVISALDRILLSPPPPRCPELWDGRAAERSVDCLLSAS